jgi:hypothetical protein
LGYFNLEVATLSKGGKFSPPEKSASGELLVVAQFIARSSKDGR